MDMGGVSDPYVKVGCIVLSIVPTIEYNIFVTLYDVILLASLCNPETVIFRYSHFMASNLVKVYI